MVSIIQTSHERLLLSGRVVVELLEFGVANSCLDPSEGARKKCACLSEFWLSVWQVSRRSYVPVCGLPAILAYARDATATLL